MSIFKEKGMQKMIRKESSRNNLTVINSTSEVEKSIFTISKIGYKALKKKMNVLHVTYGEDVEKIYSAYAIERLVEKEGKDIEVGIGDIFGENDLDELTENKVVLATRDLSRLGLGLGNVEVVSGDRDEDCIEDILDEVYKDFKFDIVVVDTFNKMPEEDKEDFVRLKDMFRREGFIAVAVNQIPKSVEEGIINKEEVMYKEEKWVLNKADTIIFLLQDEKMKKDNKMIVIKDHKGDIEEKEYTVDYGGVSFSKV